MNAYMRLRFAALGLLVLISLSLCVVEAQSWEETGAPAFSWASIACSADATKLFAVSAPYGGVIPTIYRSTNSGATWQPTSAPSQPWNSISCSADGTKLVAAGDSVFLSQDTGN